MLEEPLISILGIDPQRTHRINANSFQQNAITTNDDWQYVVFYTESKSSAGVCRVNLARRRISSTSESIKQGKWETIVFDDYDQTADDGHNTISIGVCKGDGTIHLSFDHHCDKLRFRSSTLEGGINSTWSTSQFTEMREFLPGLAHNELMDEVSYPRFVNIGDDLLLTYRIGQAGAGSDILYRYSSNTHEYVYLGQHLTGINNNPYINGIDYRMARLHISWCYRNFVEFPKSANANAHKQQAGPNGPENNHDLCYAFSDDRGETWKASDGRELARLEGKLAIGSNTSILPSARGARVFDIPMGSGILNQEGQVADWDGGFWALNREKVDGVERWMVYYRNPTGNWSKKLVSGGPLPTEIGNRGSMCVDKGSNVYLVLAGNSDNSLSILRLSKAQEYQAFDVVWAGNGYDGEPLVDAQRLEVSGILSVFTRTAGESGRRLVVLDFLLPK
ncbi:hypothetical protein BGZ60DRAFT_403127 [Tricladium varicosporioides]|nr:hypothetical protein BGZ60DRAFT_403127 [Hymenoscyphus varicosporioides]